METVSPVPSPPLDQCVGRTDTTTPQRWTGNGDRKHNTVVSGSETGQNMKRLCNYFNRLLWGHVVENLSAGVLPPVGVSFSFASLQGSASSKKGHGSLSWSCCVFTSVYYKRAFLWSSSQSLIPKAKCLYVLYIKKISSSFWWTAVDFKVPYSCSPTTVRSRGLVSVTHSAHIMVSRQSSCFQLKISDTPSVLFLPSTQLHTGTVSIRLLLALTQI